MLGGRFSGYTQGLDLSVGIRLKLKQKLWAFELSLCAGKLAVHPSDLEGSQGNRQCRSEVEQDHGDGNGVEFWQEWNVLADNGGWPTLSDDVRVRHRC